MKFVRNWKRKQERVLVLKDIALSHRTEEQMMSQLASCS